MHLNAGIQERIDALLHINADLSLDLITLTLDLALTVLQDFLVGLEDLLHLLAFSRGALADLIHRSHGIVNADHVVVSRLEEVDPLDLLLIIPGLEMVAEERLEEDVFGVEVGSEIGNDLLVETILICALLIANGCRLDWI